MDEEESHAGRRIFDQGPIAGYFTFASLDDVMRVYPLVDDLKPKHLINVISGGVNPVL